jgi:prevent-host-death family protein
MTRLTASQTRTAFADVLNRVAYGGERIVVHRRGKDLAALVPMKEYERLERILQEAEDRADAAAFKRAKRQFEKSGRKGIPWETVKARLGLK